MTTDTITRDEEATMATETPVLINAHTGEPETREERAHRLRKVRTPDNHPNLDLLRQVAASARLADDNTKGKVGESEVRRKAKEFVDANVAKVRTLATGSYRISAAVGALMSGRGYAWWRGQSSASLKARRRIAGLEPCTDAQLAKARQMEKDGKLMPVPGDGNLYVASQVWDWLRTIGTLDENREPTDRYSPGAPVRNTEKAGAKKTTKTKAKTKAAETE